MSLINNALPNLSRYSVGEIVDLSGVPDLYNAGSSLWLKSATLTASSNLTTATKTNLANAGTSDSPTVIAQGAVSASFTASAPYATYPIQRISASGISVVPSIFNSTTDVGHGVVTSAGLQAVGTGQTSIRTNSGQTGTNAFVASNDTKIFSYCFTSGTALSVKSTTNGTTWTTETVTGLPTFGADASTAATASMCRAGNSYVNAGTTGWKRGSNNTSQFGVFWCGARFLILGPGSGTLYWVASLSTNGYTFGGDNTLAVMNEAFANANTSFQFYRNGNNCYLHLGTGVKRYSTDGGITWAASTFAASPNAADFYLQYNTTDPAKLIIQGGVSSTIAYYSADSGATWSTNRALPNTASEGGLYYKGSTLVFSTGAGLYKVSTDNGVTWSNISFPIGVLSTSIVFFADANRFYAGVIGQPQLLTSSDAITWTLITLPQSFNIAAYTTQIGYGIITYSGDSNTVVLLGYNNASGYNQCLFSLDGGVTWTGSQYTSGNIGINWNVGNCFSTPDGGGIAFAWSSSDLQSGNVTPVFKSDITSGGAFYRTGVNTIAPTRTYAKAFVRVG